MTPRTAKRGLKPDAICSECGGPMFAVGFATHPTCGPEDDADVYRVTFPKAAAFAAVTAADPKLIARGAQIIAEAARSHLYLSANELRESLALKGITGPRVAVTFGRAVKDKAITRDGFVPSTHAATKGHHIARYRSLRFEGSVGAEGRTA